MSDQVGGLKRSSGRAFLRRIVLLRTLMRGGTKREQLFSAVNRVIGEDDGYIADTQNSTLKNDLDALRKEYGCRIVFQRINQTYILEDLGELALIDLPDHVIDALGFIKTSFAENNPFHHDVDELLRLLMLVVPEERREQIRNPNRNLGNIRLTLDRSSENVDKTVLKQIRRAIRMNRELGFTYRSNREDGQLVHHRVAPYHVFFRPEGHIYLDATTLDSDPREPLLLLPAATHYRIDRIVAESLKILPTVLPKERLASAAYHLRYWLHPNVARRGDFAVAFPDATAEAQADGSAIVSARVTNLWQTRQTLLRYGSACRVLDPPELIELFRKALREMQCHYFAAEEPSV